MERFVDVFTLIINIVLAIYFVKSYQILFFKYENTWKEELSKNFKPLKYYIPVILFVVFIALLINIILPTTYTSILKSKTVVTQEKVDLSKDIINKLYIREPSTLADEELIQFISEHTTQEIEYKLDTRNLANLRDRHLQYTSPNTKINYEAITYNDKQVVLEYYVINPDNETKHLVSIFEFYQDKISNYNEYVLDISVNYVE